jgi:release factor glutamine methyltransferase
MAEVIRPSELVRGAAGVMQHHDVESPAVNAEILLAWVLGTDRADLYSRTSGLTKEQAREFDVAVRRRCEGVPLQHLTGDQPFRALRLEVRPGVFVPRQETELLVDAAIDLIREISDPVVVDVGTGTGAIALSIAAEVPNARVVGIDLDPTAAALARHNAGRLGLGVEVREGNLLTPAADLRGVIDLVVSNPPYLEPGELAGLSREVRADPALAVAGGIHIYRELVYAAATALRPRGGLAVEIGSSQGPEVAAAVRSRFDEVRVLPDLLERDRIVVARRR